MQCLNRILPKTSCQIVRKSSIIRCVATSVNVKPFKSIPGPVSLPIFGTSWQFFPIIGDGDVMHLNLLSEKYYKKYGSIVRETFGKIDVLHLFEPEHFEVVAKATLNNPLRLGFLALAHYRDACPHKYNSPGILPLNDERWWQLRQLFQKPVSPFKEARNFLGPTDDITKELVDSFKSGVTIEDFMNLANRLNMELICKLLFDERVHCFDEKALDPNSYMSNLITKSVAMAEGFGKLDQTQMIWQYVKSKSYKNMEQTLNLLEEFAINMIEKVKSRGNLSEEKCVVAQYLNNSNIHRDELLGIIIDLLIGGIHTTAITSSFLLFHISKHPDIQAKLIEESKRLIPDGSSITTSTLNDAVYSRAVIKETLRLTPISTALARTLPDDLVIDKYMIPKNTVVVLQTMAACRNDKYFKEPLKFKPERWIKDSPEFEQVSPYLVMPFGLGARQCIARRRAEQNFLVLTLRMFNSGSIEWMRETDLGFTTPFMISPDGPVKFKYTRH